MRCFFLPCFPGRQSWDSDFFSIGISWWELLTGTRPYEFQQLIDSLTRGQDLPIPPPRPGTTADPPQGRLTMHA